MPRTATPTFIAELPLILVADDERVLTVRLDCARMVYNAVVGEALKRLDLLHQSKAYQAACALPKRTPEQQRSRTDAFRALDLRFLLREYDMHAYATHLKHSWIGAHLDSNTVQTVASRAWQAVRQYQVGLRGKPRYKGHGQFDSVEGKSNSFGIRWRDGQVRWGGRSFRAQIDPTDAVIAHALACPVKYVRLVRRKVNGRACFVAQLVCTGYAYQKPRHPRGSGIIGIDPGPRTFGIAGAAWGVQVDLAMPLDQPSREQRRLQRKLDRQRRANNPDNYLPDGRIKPGKKTWKDSKNYLETRTRLAERSRKQAAQRKSLHGQLANALLAVGNDFRIEKNSYKSFQKNFGKAVGHAAPATFVTHLMQKAVSAAATVTVIPTSLRLSQTCLCGTIARKVLSERVHRCDCGITVQRDVFSAWLARFSQATEGPHGPLWRLDANQAHCAWDATEGSLPTASSRLTVAQFVAWLAAQSASGGSHRPASLPSSDGGTERIVGVGQAMISDSADAVVPVGMASMGQDRRRESREKLVG